VIENMNNKEMILFIGIQASGKTTFYHEQLAQYEHVSLDILHTRNKERIAIEEAFSLGKSMVIDNTNPTVADRESYIRKAKENGYQIPLAEKCGKLTLPLRGRRALCFR